MQRDKEKLECTQWCRWNIFTLLRVLARAVQYSTLGQIHRILHANATITNRIYFNVDKSQR